MIITKFVYIKITKRNIDFFSVNYKDIKLKDIIKVNPENLQKNSNKKIDVACDICKTERNITVQSYNKNINSNKELNIYTCDKCSHIKIKDTNLKKYGVEYYSQTPEYTDKFEKTMMNRYGASYSTQSKEIYNKIKKTTLKNYGVENIFENTKYIKKKFKEKYGVYHPSKVKEIYQKIENSNFERHGFKSPLSNPEVRKIFKEKYGKNSPHQIEKFRINKITENDNYIKYLGDNISLFKCVEGHNFEIDSITYHNRNRSNIPFCTICYPIGDTQSIKENELYKYIKSIYSGEIIQSYRDGLEIDIYLPELGIGFEFNGLYWHSDIHKEKNYHLNKTNYFKSKNIRIIHIWEDEWDFKLDIIKSQIKNWLGLTKNKIYARKCEVKELKNSKLVNKFLEQNHIQGKIGSSLKLGLFHENELVSLMIFDNFEGRRKMEEGGWNLSRFCNLINYNIIGGFSKLFKFFIRNYDVKRVISYSDNDWSLGSIYENNKFNLVKIGEPDYKYFIEDKRIHKSRYRKSFTGISESKLNIPKIWDCGKNKYELIKISI